MMCFNNPNSIISDSFALLPSQLQHSRLIKRDRRPSSNTTHLLNHLSQKQLPTPRQRRIPNSTKPLKRRLIQKPKPIIKQTLILFRLHLLQIRTLQHLDMLRQINLSRFLTRHYRFMLLI